MTQSEWKSSAESPFYALFFLAADNESVFALNLPVLVCQVPINPSGGGPLDVERDAKQKQK